ncbi:CLUMA_CG002813, isoform A [Clunio marinus]|uniref:CLUMA_CG002813, isoform A n=1 Tax=Clunio marinus TaxID=568069 RepID=A0A1J1HL23_9DIPT|nr:CLUMA_CG002813, isoform A [Clunio marinus]
MHPMTACREVIGSCWLFYQLYGSLKRESLGFKIRINADFIFVALVLVGKTMKTEIKIPTQKYDRVIKRRRGVINLDFYTLKRRNKCLMKKKTKSKRRSPHISHLRHFELVKKNSQKKLKVKRQLNAIKAEANDYGDVI